MTTYRTTIPLSLAILLSPEVQVLLGNGMGMVGWLFPLFLLLVAALHLLTLRAYGDIYEGRYQGGSEHAFLRAIFGPWLPLTTALASRGVFMVCVGTISLVTAGFVFNEVFVSWFPNFAFAFLLLALLLAIQLAGRRPVLAVQNFLVVFVLAMMALLLGAGFWKLPAFPPVGAFVLQGRGVLLPFFMVVGVEFAYLGRDRRHAGLPAFATGVKMLVGTVLVFSLWGLVMAQFGEAARLARSFNPQMIGARLVLGEPGRMLMGAALIAGAAALVNALLLVLRCQLAELVPESWRRQDPGKQKWWSIFAVVALAALPALMMATGMAGEEIIDVYGRAALVIWLCHYSLIHFAVSWQTAARRLRHLLACLIVLGAAVALGWSDPQPLVLLKSVALIVLVVGTVSLIITKLGQKLTSGG